jgi:hypothetical protein
MRPLAVCSWSHRGTERISAVRAAQSRDDTFAFGDRVGPRFSIEPSHSFQGFGSWRGVANLGQSVAAPPRRSALGYFFIAPSRREDGRITSAGPRRTTNPAETGHASRNRPAPKGQNRLAQGRARRRSRRAPPWVNGHPRTCVALKERGKCATNASQTRETERRNNPNADVTRDVADSFCPSKGANLRHPFTSGSQLFVITSLARMAIAIGTAAPSSTEAQA